MRAHHENTQNGKEYTHGGNQHGSDHSFVLHDNIRTQRESRGTQGSSSQHGTSVRLIQVGAHTGHVTHVVTHIVGNGSRVAGVIFRDTSFHLTHEVSAHVCSFGVNTTTHTSKQSLCGSTHTKGQHCCGNDGQFMSRIRQIHIRKIIQDQVPSRDVDEHQADDNQTHDSTTTEGNLQTLVQGADGSVGGTGRGVSRRFHTQVTGKSREKTTGKESDRYPWVLHVKTIGHDGENNHHAEEHDTHYLVLLPEVRHGSLTDKLGNGFHFVGSFAGLHHLPIEEVGETQGHDGSRGHDPENRCQCIHV